MLLKSVRRSLIQSFSLLIPVAFLLTGCGGGGSSDTGSVKQPFTITMSPPTVTAKAGTTIDVMATVTGGEAANPPVAWMVLEGQGSLVPHPQTPTSGTTSTATYSVPTQPGTYHVQASLKDAPTVFATCTVTVQS